MALDFFVERLQDRYRLHNVWYEGRQVKVDWCRRLLADEPLPYPELLERTCSSEWRIADAPLYHVSLEGLYFHRNAADVSQRKIVEEVRQLFQRDFERLPYMLTSTSVRYRFKGGDRVTHKKGYDSEQSVLTRVRGDEGFLVAKKDFEQAVQALLGAGVESAKQVYVWASGVKPFLCRGRKNLRVDLEMDMQVCLGKALCEEFHIHAYSAGEGWARGVLIRS